MSVSARPSSPLHRRFGAICPGRRPLTRSSRRTKPIVKVETQRRNLERRTTGQTAAGVMAAAASDKNKSVGRTSCAIQLLESQPPALVVGKRVCELLVVENRRHRILAVLSHRDGPPAANPGLGDGGMHGLVTGHSNSPSNCISKLRNAQDCLVSRKAAHSEKIDICRQFQIRGKPHPSLCPGGPTGSSPGRPSPVAKAAWCRTDPIWEGCPETPPSDSDQSITTESARKFLQRINLTGRPLAAGRAWFASNPRNYVPIWYSCYWLALRDALCINHPRSLNPSYSYANLLLRYIAAGARHEQQF